MLLGPVWHIALDKICLVAAGPHHSSLRNLRFNLGVSVPEEAHPESVLVLLQDIGRRHADGVVARVVVRVHQVLDDINPTHGATVRQICQYSGLDNAVKWLLYVRFLLGLMTKW